MYHCNSFVRILSSSSGERRRRNSPLWAMEMLPVSSLTTTANASLSWEIPMAARWRRPNSFGISRSWLTGKMQPAALTRFLEIITAPSCNGEFLKKIFSNKRWLMFASITSPVAIMSSNGTDCSITIKAPTFPLLIFMADITIGMMVSLTSFWSSPFPFENDMNRMRARIFWWAPKL